MAGMGGGGIWRRGRLGVRRRAPSAAPPAISLFLLLLAWELFVLVFSVPRYLVVRPTEIAVYLVTNFGALQAPLMLTVAESVGGFLAGSAIGVALALLIAASKLLSRAILPLVVASQVVPKPAIAPVILVLVGYGVHAGVVIAATIAFFPVVMTYAYGLLSVPNDMLDLARSVRAGPVKTFFKIRLPHSLPALFAGLKTASSLAVIGAVVGEFVGASQGLGYVVLQANAQINTPLLYSAIILLAFLGIGLFLVLSWIEGLVVGARGEPEAGMGLPASPAS